MNAINYVMREATSFGYCGKMRWEDGMMVALPDNFPFMRGRQLTEEEHDLMQQGQFLCGEVKKCAKQLTASLERQGREYFKDWNIPMSLYKCEVDYGDVTCDIVFTHKKNRGEPLSDGCVL